MDFWEFLARSEWPIVVAGALYVFREPIKKKLESVTKVTVPGASAEFLHQVNEQTKLVREALPHIKDASTAKALETANTAVSSTLGTLRVTEAPDRASFTVETTR
jgi:hypothetical protein